MKCLFKIGLILLLFCGSASATELRNDAALAGLTETKVIFDINQGDPDLLLLRLKLIDKTYWQLLEFASTPKFILAFRGKASRYVTADDSYIKPTELVQKKEIEELIVQLKKEGMVLEQCALAANMQRIDINDFLPQIDVVANGYISMIGYQNKGYAFVPMD